MLQRYGRFPKKKEWWGEDGSYEKWKEKWVATNPMSLVEGFFKPVEY